MRGFVWAVGLAAGLAGAGTVRAGVYNPGALQPFPWPQNFRDAQSQLGEYRAIAQPQQAKSQRGGAYASQAELYARQVKLLEAKTPDEWTLNDRLSLSACYIRQLKYDKAVGVLRGADQHHFLVLLNLAAAQHGLGDLTQAVTYQQAALAAWPSLAAGWSQQELERARRMERYNLTLLQLREREQRLGKKQWETVDDLFPGCRFVGPSGKYEAGALARKSADALPPDVLDITLQLVLWMPFDDRLYWLLGELLNARGDIESATAVLNELYSVREHSNVAELRQHRRVLMEAAGTLEGWKKWQDALMQHPTFNQDLLGSLQLTMLPSLMTPPAIGPASIVAGATVPSQVVKAVTGTQNVAAPPAAKAPPDPGNWLPNWRHVTISFVAGALVATLVNLQWREWQRRQQAAASAERYQQPPAAVKHQPSDGSFHSQG